MTEEVQLDADEIWDLVKIKLKCRFCGLEYIVLTDFYKKIWKEKITGIIGCKIFCPECGKQNSTLLGVERVDNAIWEESPTSHDPDLMRD